MKAAVHRRGTIEIADVELPELGNDDVLVRVQATTVCAADYRMGTMMRSIPGRVVLALRRKPMIMGMELSGTVESVGKSVTRLRPGDEVFGGTGFRLRTQAEYASAQQINLELKPSNMALEESAAVFFGGMTALTFLRPVGIQPGQRVLIYGASGSVGVFAVQLAKYLGAHVTGVCSTSNLELVRSFGADEVIDYTRQDFSATEQKFDVIFDAVGKSGFNRSLRCLKRGAPYVRIAPSGGNGLPSFLGSMITDTVCQLWISATGAAKAMGGIPKAQPDGPQFLRERIEAGDFRTTIDRHYGLDQIADAYRYAEAGHKKGHVLVHCR